MMSRDKREIVPWVILTALYFLYDWGVSLVSKERVISFWYSKTIISFQNVNFTFFIFAKGPDTVLGTKLMLRNWMVCKATWNCNIPT